MDRKFHPAIAAIESDDLEKFKAHRNVKNTKVGSPAAGSANHGGHPDLRDMLS